MVREQPPPKQNKTTGVLMSGVLLKDGKQQLLELEQVSFQEYIWLRVPQKQAICSIRWPGVPGGSADCGIVRWKAKKIFSASWGCGHMPFPRARFERCSIYAERRLF